MDSFYDRGDLQTSTFLESARRETSEELSREHGMDHLPNYTNTQFSFTGISCKTDSCLDRRGMS